MGVTLRIIVESVDDTSQKILSKEVIKDTPIKPVESILDLGFRGQSGLRWWECSLNCVIFLILTLYS
jgi:hypothetical protein